MREDYHSRRYSEEEFRQIVAAAAEAEARPEPPASMEAGLTLTDMQQIGAEVGIDPAAIDRAAAEFAIREPLEGGSKASGHFDRIPREEIILPRVISDAERNRLVSLVEAVVGRPGTLLQTERWLEWKDPRRRVKLAVVRGASQTRLAIAVDQSPEVSFGASGIGALGVLNVMNIAGAGATALLAGGAWVAGTVGLIALYWRWRSRVGRNHAKEFLEILRDGLDGGDL